MSDHEAPTVGEFLVAFSKSHIENFAKMHEILLRHDEALNRVEVILSELKTMADTMQTAKERLSDQQQPREVPPANNNPIFDEVFQQIEQPTATSTPKAPAKREANEASSDLNTAAEVDLAPTTEDVPIPAHVKEHRKNDKSTTLKIIQLLIFFLRNLLFRL